MPHVVIKAFKGPSQEAYEKAARQIAAILEETLGKPTRYTSVSLEEYDPSEWEGVFNVFVKDKENVILRPGYTDPNTFL
ncbi:MAG: tautomerase family protein [Firmicutes bacterium]|nr:tautomerase family protein [Bacillota bacterium]